MTDYLSWQEAQKFCQDKFGTNISPPTETNINVLKSILNPPMKSYVGLIKDLENTNEANDGWASWMRLDGGECPSKHTDENGNELCYDQDIWGHNEPNNAYSSEHCAELRTNGQLNDIMCFGLPQSAKYPYIQGFPCDEPDDYYVDFERTQIAQKYIVDISSTTEPEMMNTTKDDPAHLGFKEWIILGLVFIDVSFIICIAVSVLVTARQQRIVHDLRQRLSNLQHGNGSISSDTRDDAMGATDVTSSCTESSRYSHNESGDFSIITSECVNNIIQ